MAPITSCDDPVVARERPLDDLVEEGTSVALGRRSTCPRLARAPHVTLEWAAPRTAPRVVVPGRGRPRQAAGAPRARHGWMSSLLAPVEGPSSRRTPSDVIRSQSHGRRAGARPAPATGRRPCCRRARRRRRLRRRAGARSSRSALGGAGALVLRWRGFACAGAPGGAGTLGGRHAQRRPAPSLILACRLPQARSPGPLSRGLAEVTARASDLDAEGFCCALRHARAPAAPRSRGGARGMRR